MDPSWWGASDSFWQPLHEHNTLVQMHSWRLTGAFKRRGSAMKCDWNWHIMFPLFTNCNCWELFHFHSNQTNTRSLKFYLYATFYTRETTKASRSTTHNQIGSQTRCKNTLTSQHIDTVGTQQQRHTHTPKPQQMYTASTRGNTEWLITLSALKNH